MGIMYYLRINDGEKFVLTKDYTSKSNLKKELQSFIKETKEKIMIKEYTKKGLPFRSDCLLIQKTFGGILTYESIHPDNNFTICYYVDIYSDNNEPESRLLEELFLN